jgi:hypothetical protein
MEIAYNRKIRIYGVTFNGFSDIKKFALTGKPKDGVYVGEDSERYPCFDSSDYEYENRFYWNFVFARSQEELDQKLRRLRSMGHGGNYRKFTDGLSPMIYFQGDSHYPLEVTAGKDVIIL